MNEGETGNQKGSLRDRILAIKSLLKINKKKKLNVKFNSFNSERLAKAKKLNLRFYNPAKVMLDDKLKTKNTVLYKKAGAEKSKLSSTKKLDNIEISVTKKVRKKGIDPNANKSKEVKPVVKEVKVEKPTMKPVEKPVIKEVTVKPNIEIIDVAYKEPVKRPKQYAVLNVKKDEIKEEISKKYNLPKGKVSENLVEDYILIKTDQVLPKGTNEEVKEEFISDRVFVKDEMDLIYAFKDNYITRDVNYDLNGYQKVESKLKKALDKFNDEIEKLERNLDKYSVTKSENYRIKNLDVLFKSLFGIGVGVLTLPLSSISFALGSSLIAKSVDKIEKNVKLEKKVKTSINYRVTIKDIINTSNTLNSANYLLEETLKNLDSLKYKVKRYDSKIYEAEKYIKKIEILEESLIKKKRKLDKYISKLEKSKVKVLERKAA